MKKQLKINENWKKKLTKMSKNLINMQKSA